jgi:predicted DNA-binding antitoxin AbrB/MazE fold protein
MAVPGERIMSMTVEAVYENGVLKPTQPLPLSEHAKVRVTIHPASNWVQETYGLCGWTGDPEALRQLALDPGFASEP